jgi:hypothetical protein
MMLIFSQFFFFFHLFSPSINFFTTLFLARALDLQTGEAKSIPEISRFYAAIRSDLLG